MSEKQMNGEQNVNEVESVQQTQEEAVSQPQQAQGETEDKPAIQPQQMQGDAGNESAVQLQKAQGETENESAIQPQQMQGDAENEPAIQPQQMQGEMGSQHAESQSSQQENHAYRYDRSYYQNKEDSVYHTNDTYSQNAAQAESQAGCQNSQQTQGHNTYQTYNTHQNVNPNTPQKVQKPKKTWKKVGKVAACVAVIAAVGAGSAFGTVYYMDHRDDDVRTVGSADSTDVRKKTTAAPVSTVSASTAIVTDVSDVVENCMPSVVSITNIGTQTYSGFFGQTGTYEAESNGSGIIIGQTEDELLVATNQHVVAGADTLSVIFIDEEVCEANVKGTDADKDLAVIAVPIDSIKEETLDKIKVATLGDSDALNVGEPAIAIGNSLGYGQSVTLGVISAKDREVTTESYTNKLIQTDAAINPGNSGGALLNMAGEVIGINSVKYSSTEVEGMGYAIPISDATPIINELMNKETKKKVDDDEQSYMGISGVDITSDVAQTYNMPKGVYVAQVVKGGPADEAGLRKGDIITKIEDVSVTSFDELQAELEYYAAGTTVTLEVQTPARDSYGYESEKVRVTLEKKKD